MPSPPPSFTQMSPPVRVVCSDRAQWIPSSTLNLALAGLKRVSSALLCWKENTPIPTGGTLFALFSMLQIIFFCILQKKKLQCTNQNTLFPFIFHFCSHSVCLVERDSLGYTCVGCVSVLYCSVNSFFSWIGRYLQWNTCSWTVNYLPIWKIMFEVFGNLHHLHI